MVAGKRGPLGLSQHSKGQALFWTDLMVPEKMQSANALNQQGLLGTKCSLFSITAGVEVPLRQCQHIENTERRRVVHQMEEVLE